jgi:hypothetical protein
MKLVPVLALCLFVSEVFAQGPIITPLNGNAQLKNSEAFFFSKRQITDTIQLPFLEDFTSTTLLPNALYWTDKQVYINNHFAISPPSYNVATFDNLDSKGRPYQALSGLTQNHCDSLTSNYINLKNFKSVGVWKNYSAADSIYLSFYYQMQGRGDVLDQTDSLVLKFKNSTGLWKTVWKISGKNDKKFKQVLVGIKDAEYLHNNFQFRFINYGKSTGNMNQWHLDYIRLNSSRSSKDTAIQDVAINAIPFGPLKWYATMPYDHFKVSPSYHTAPSHSVVAHNNNDTTVNVQFTCEVRNQYNQLVLFYPNTGSSRNILKFSDSTEFYTGLQLDTFSGKKPSLTFKHKITPLTLDNLPDDYNSLASNNEYSNTFKFNNFFAYDDGTAEGGYGLDYGSLPNGPGYAAIKFNAPKADTLRGISIFFNRSVADITNKSFSLMIWKSISEPPANSDDNDVLFRRVEIPTAFYSDSINGFVDIVLDTAVALDAGDFYIGWQQNINFMLNIGYDNNYKYAQSGGRNPNLFYNLNGYWETVSATITGAPMMRPIVGEPLPKKATSVSQIKSAKQNIKLYPNPSGNSSVLDIISDKTITQVEVYDLSGKLMIKANADSVNQVNIAALSPGFYTIRCTSINNQITNLKYIKN